MNLTFGICWIEDQASEAEVEQVEQAVRSNGFQPEITRIEEEEDIRAFAERQHHFQEFELILLDLRLGNNLRGNEIAPEIRRQFRSTPILFYSAVDEQELRQMMADKLVEGAYCTHRDRLTSRVGELVQDLSPVLNRLSGMRGLAAQIVAECDQEFRLMLSEMGAVEGESDCITASLKARSREMLVRQGEEIEELDSLERLLVSHHVTSGMLYNEATERVRAGTQTDEIRTVLRQMKNYQSQVLMRRNVLAHALEEESGGGWLIRRADTPKTISTDDFGRYRREFLANLRAVLKLRSLLIPEQPD